MKKRTWLVSATLLLITCAFLFNYFYEIERTNKINEIVASQKIYAKLASRSFNESFEKWNSVLYYLSNDKNVILLNQSGRNELQHLLELLKDEIKGITRTDKTGKIIYTIPYYPNSIGADISGQKHMRKILADHMPVMSDVFNAVQGFQAVVIHYPVYKDKKFDGTIALLLDFEHITKKILDDIKIGESGYAWMLSSEGIELYCPVPGHIGKSIYETSRGFPELLTIGEKMLSGEEGTATYTYNNVVGGGKVGKKIVYYLPIRINNTFWSLAISYSEHEIIASLTNFRNRLIFIFCLIFAGAMYFSYLGVKAWLIVKESGLRKTAEDALEQERTLLRTLIDNLPNGVYVKDKSYRKIIVNPIQVNRVNAHLKFLGIHTLDDILGKTDFEVYPVELAERYLAVDKKVLEEGIALLNQVEQGMGPDMKPIWLLVSKVPIRDANNNIIGMIGVSTDITERKNAEEQLVIAKEKAEESDRLKTSFLHNISHEIRTPLNAINGFAGLLKITAQDDDKRQNYINIIIESCNQLLFIINDVLNISTIETGQVKVNLVEVDINSTLHILHEQYKARAISKKLSFTYHPALKSRDATIVTDYTKFIEIVSNLINNAIKFTEKGKVRFGYELKDQMLEFYIEDTGIGVKKEFEKSIFERFNQADNGLSIKYGGTGLGLAISKAYVEILGGSIWLNSSPGSGTTFYFTIPYRPAKAVQREASC